MRLSSLFEKSSHQRCRSYSRLGARTTAEALPAVPLVLQAKGVKSPQLPLPLHAMKSVQQTAWSGYTQLPAPSQVPLHTSSPCPHSACGSVPAG